MLANDLGDHALGGVDARGIGDHLVSPSETDVGALDLGEALGNVGPIYELPETIEPLFLAVLILQVVGVLPHVYDEDRQGAVPDIALVVEHLLDDEAFAEG